MGKGKNFHRLTCEQVYNIWSTEPELVALLDLRPAPDFAAGHIPGAQPVTVDHLDLHLRGLEGRLAVLISAPADEADLKNRYGRHPDVTFLSDCHRWPGLDHPLAGLAVQAIRRQTEKDDETGEAMQKPMIFHQLFEPESSTYTYLIADPTTKEAALVDPVLETVERDLQLVEELGLRLMYVLDTHVHADHITGAAELRQRVGARIALSRESGADGADILLEDGQQLRLGAMTITAIATPGHTGACMSFHVADRVFTGDALLIRGTGRTDFQQGSADTLYDSVHRKLFALPDDTLVYPGHDYRGQTSSTIGMEKLHNPRLGGGRSKTDFIKTMAELKLANPKKIHEAVPANLACGRPRDARVLHPQKVDGIPEVSVTDVLRAAGRVRVIDVRRPDEFNNELGHIAGAELVTLGPDLTALLEKGDRSQEIVFACRSGGRSGQATAESLRLGYKHTSNMTGGMLRWNAEKLPVERT